MLFVMIIHTCVFGHIGINSTVCDCFISDVVFTVIDDVNWNPMDWDRAAEELTWERV